MGQLGGRKGDKIVAAAPIPGFGCKLHCENDVVFNCPGPSEFRPRPHVSFFMCSLTLIQILVGSSSTDLGDLTLAGMTCQINHQSVSFPSFLCPHSRTRSISKLQGTRTPTLLLIATCGLRGRTTPTPVQSILPSALRFS